MTTINLEVIDISIYLHSSTSPEALQECSRLATALKTYSAVAIRDARVSETANSNFIDIMEDYFEQPYETKLVDTRPDIAYQVGATPSNVELPRCGRDEVSSYLI